MDPNYEPQRENGIVTKKLGLRVSVFQRGPGHMQDGYADPFGTPGQSEDKGINLSTRAYQQLYTLITQAKKPSDVTVAMCRAMFVLGHEMGHVFAKKHTSEVQANNYMFAHIGLIGKKLGLSKAVRNRINKEISSGAAFEGSSDEGM